MQKGEGEIIEQCGRCKREGGNEESAAAAESLAERSGTLNGSKVTEHSLRMCKISLDPAASRGATICGPDSELVLLGGDDAWLLS